MSESDRFAPRTSSRFQSRGETADGLCRNGIDRCPTSRCRRTPGWTTRTAGSPRTRCRTRASRGRRHPEPDHPFRTLYQRDRERIVHCTAFRRMTGKTQVLVASVNDHHRTRLTHTLEVAQIARTVARRLRLNEDLTEAIALAHDIGHPPFGHAGEARRSTSASSRFGGFDHNLFGLRRVDELEERYPEFPGLNLSFEVREAFVRHSGNLDAPEATEFRRRRAAAARSAGRRCGRQHRLRHARHRRRPRAGVHHPGRTARGGVLGPGGRARSRQHTRD